MDRVIYSPMKYVQGEGAWQRLHEYAAALGQKGAYAVAGPHVLEHYWSDVEKDLKRPISRCMRTALRANAP